jgi:hypothetical protein
VKTKNMVRTSNQGLAKYLLCTLDATKHDLFKITFTFKVCSK